jgi:hypothetical protein
MMSLSFMMSRSSPYEQVLAVDLDLGAGPLVEQHAVANLQVERSESFTFVSPARTNRDDFAFPQLFLGGVGDDDPAFGLFLALKAFDPHPIIQGTKRHFVFFPFWAR